MTEQAWLRELQRLFQASMASGDASVLPQLATDRCIPRELGLGIYSHAYHARLREALESDHAVLARYLGDQLWERLCREYVAASPSRYRSLRNFGDHLPAFLAGRVPFAAHPMLAELARFERLLLDCFDAPDAGCASWSELESLQAGDWPGLRIRFQPALRRALMLTNSVETWKALKAGLDPPEASTQAPRDWVLWRDSEQITRFRPLAEEEAQAVDRLWSGSTFAEFCELLLRWHTPEAVPARGLEWLRTWAAEGWIAGWLAPAEADA